MSRLAPYLKAAPVPVTAAPAEPLAHEFVNVVAPMANALEIIRLVAGANPDVARALKVMDRQVDAMRKLAERMRPTQ